MRSNGKPEPMITSKLTSKARTTLPLPVRNALRIAKGEEIAYTIEGNRVVIAKADRRGAENPLAIFGEWSSEADTRAYAEL